MNASESTTVKISTGLALSLDAIWIGSVEMAKRTEQSQRLSLSRCTFKHHPESDENSRLPVAGFAPSVPSDRFHAPGDRRRITRNERRVLGSAPWVTGDE